MKSKYLAFALKVGLSLCCLYFMLPTAAQERGYEIKEHNKTLKIALREVLGNWHMADSSAHTIRFVNINNQLVELYGIRHGVGNYTFAVQGDSISVNGLAPNWPPYDCTLRLLPENRLEVQFYQHSSAESTKVVYRR